MVQEGNSVEMWKLLGPSGIYAYKIEMQTLSVLGTVFLSSSSHNVYFVHNLIYAIILIYYIYNFKLQHRLRPFLL